MYVWQGRVWSTWVGMGACVCMWEHVYAMQGRAWSTWVGMRTHVCMTETLLQHMCGHGDRCVHV